MDFLNINWYFTLKSAGSFVRQAEVLVERIWFIWGVLLYTTAILHVNNLPCRKGLNIMRLHSEFSFTTVESESQVILPSTCLS